jgi:hypothetical protein
VRGGADGGGCLGVDIPATDLTMVANRVTFGKQSLAATLGFSPFVLRRLAAPFSLQQGVSASIS